MHGVKRYDRAKVDKAKREAERRKVTALFEKTREVLDMCKQEVLNEEALAATQGILETSVDFYTLWNYRKRILLAWAAERSAQDMKDVWVKELAFVTTCLKVNPKVYAVWHHRAWVVRRVADAKLLARELALCAMLLDVDHRNFHCWGYRKLCAQLAGRSTDDEVAFTTGKINQNFSNYSAWHYRSVLLGQRAGDSEAAVRAELHLVQQAVFTSPEDSSAWLYLRWLTGSAVGVFTDDERRALLQEQHDMCAELLEEEPDSKWTLLTLLVLRHALGSAAADKEDTRARVARLQALDPKRAAYYTDVWGM